MIPLSSLFTVDVMVGLGMVMVAIGAIIFVSVPARPSDHRPDDWQPHHRAGARDAITQRMAAVPALPAAPSSHPRSRNSESLGDAKPGLAPDPGWSTLESLTHMATAVLLQQQALDQARDDVIRHRRELSFVLVRPYVTCALRKQPTTVETP